MKKTNYSICGIDCNACKHKMKDGCMGCKENKGNIFWGECDLYKCCQKQKVKHCGNCNKFPCETLKEWASNENAERIDNLKKLMK